MRILHLTPGTGNFHCGSCLRDHALIKALRARGHDAMMLPLYLPLVTDREFGTQELPVQIGGISLFLQQKFTWFHKLPKFVHRWLNTPDRLRKAARRMGMTSPKALGEMALGSLLGTEGRQWGEWQKLIEWIRSEPKFDVVSFSNSLLTGLAPTIETELGLPVVCSLQGEDSFLDTLPDPYREQCWDAMRTNARSIRRFIAPSQYYADLMRQRLAAEPTQIKVIPNGIDASSFTTSSPDPNWPVIGYFARMIHGKGLTTLVDAFIDLAKRGTVPRVKLRIGGAKTPVDEKYVAGLVDKLKAAGLANRVEFHPNLSFKDKVHFFHDLTVFSVPATYGEAFGLYVIEAAASGVPVVQPDHAAFPELIAATEGGVLCKPDDPKALADALEALLNDDELREKLSKAAMAKVRQEFSASRMAERFEAVLLEARASAV
ncbi:glycosyltransferase family 4 protein [Prosthecobacter sp.]|uniref:glycosyltransferase family 4 protein n=1 Tax=Prosthecobacter sp. TaxID=1965333 RepID=UPI002AB92F7D|nr:glycosyltransferase family 4 protein [Prosthecobacter sp.]MDZ4405499.1 glycosyltransferase family 4 protein [Prosthecobacter sp.]